jgi:hypothetical protein
LLQFILFRSSLDGFVLPRFRNPIKSVVHIDEIGRRVPLEWEVLPDGNRRLKISLMAVRDTLGAVVLISFEGQTLQR